MFREILTVASGRITFPHCAFSIFEIRVDIPKSHHNHKNLKMPGGNYVLSCPKSQKFNPELIFTLFSKVTKHYACNAYFM